MENPDICPFCGAKPIKKNPYSDRIEKFGLGGGVATISVEGNVNIKPNPQKEEYYLCDGCNRKYVWAQIDISIIVEHFLGTKNVALLINNYYHGEVTLTELLTEYRTGIVRKHSDKFSFITNLLVKRQIYVCFCYKGNRTYASFIKEQKDNRDYYVIKSVGVP